MSVNRVEVVERIQGDSLPFTCCPVNREYSWQKSQIEKKKTTKKQIMLYNMEEKTLGVCGWRASWIFHDGGPYCTDSSPLIYITNHWTGCYTTRTSVMKELMLCYLHVLNEIYSLIMTKQLASMDQNIKGRCF